MSRMSLELMETMFAELARRDKESRELDRRLALARKDNVELQGAITSLRMELHARQQADLRAAMVES